MQGLACKVQQQIQNQIRNRISKKEHQEILLGILLGNDEGMEQETKENFIGSSLSHVLAVSGMHVAYMIIIVNFLLSTCKVGKRKTKIITIGFLIFFMLLTNNTPSVKRACIMTSLGIVAFLINQKSDVINNMAISLFLILIQNPFSILNTGLILSYSASLGIILLSPIFLEEKIREDNKSRKIWAKKIKPIIVVSISAQIAIFPISIVLFQTISLTFIFSNLLVSFIIGSIMMLGFLISIPIEIPFFFPIVLMILDMLLTLLMKISEIFSGVPLSHILVCPPNLIVIILYYASVFFWIYQTKLKRKK